MATVTIPVCDHRGLVSLTVSYDDTDVTFDADGGIIDAALVRFTLTNNHTDPIRLNIRRSNGAAWHERLIEPGVHTFEAGGPVRRFSSLAKIELGVVWRP